MPASPVLSRLELAAPDDGVQVWYASLDQPVACQDRLIGSCDAAERRRAARLQRPQAARDQLIGRGLLRAVLAAASHRPAEQVRLVVAPSGKPALADVPELRFSVSSCAGLVAIALARSREVGIDLEHRGRRLDVDLLARTVLLPSEAAGLGPPGRQRSDAFLRRWTAREAVGKGLGTGLGWRIGGPGGALWSTAGPPTDAWCVRELPAPSGFLATLALAPPAAADVSPTGPRASSGGRHDVEPPGTP